MPPAATCSSLTRRRFIGGGATGLALLAAGCRAARSTAVLPDRRRVAFNTANLVGRYTDYRFELARWGEQHLS